MTRPSRYAPVRPFEATADGSPMFDGIMPRIVPTPEGVVEHVVREGDRLDELAHDYYNDSRLWYHILDANPQVECGTDLTDPDVYASNAAEDEAVPEAHRLRLRPNLVGSMIVIPSAPTGVRR